MTHQPLQNNLPVPTAPGHIHHLETSIASLHPSLAGYLQNLNLPTENVFVAAEERSIVINGFENAISMLKDEDRTDAYYLSKFTVAATVGLFDAALNYLWNETINSLRRLIVATDLSYFFDVAEKREGHRAKLQEPEDLAKIEDLTLIETCARIGLLNEVNKERLRHINYMRNHASAAHPNQNDLNGSEMLGWLANCIRYAITANPDVSMVNVKKLLNSIKLSDIPATDAPVIAAEASRLDQPRVDDLMWTLFGMFTDLRSDVICRGNIAKLAPYLWPVVSENRKYEIGARMGYFLKHGEQARKEASSDFLTRVDGLRYRSEDVLTVELLDKLRTLYQVHVAWNNFYNEWPHAQALSSSLPPSGVVPRAARSEWVKVISMCFIGNGMGYRDGVDHNAVPFYTAFINAFGEAEIVELIHLFADDGFTDDLHMPKADHRARMLLNHLKGMTSNVLIKSAIDVILNHPQQLLKKVGITTAYRTAIQNLPTYP